MIGQRATRGYGTLGTLFHDAENPRASESEVAWYAAHLPRDAGLVLEAMAGSGRLLLPLIEAGFQMHGVDASAARIASCERRLAASGYKAQIYRQDVAALNLPSRYAAALIAGGSFQSLIDPVAALDALLRIRAHLVEPARVVEPVVAQHVRLGDGNDCGREFRQILSRERRELRVRDVGARTIDIPVPGHLRAREVVSGCEPLIRRT